MYVLYAHSITPFDCIYFSCSRYLVPLKDQVTYDRLIPPRGYDKVRTVRLKKLQHQGLGFTVRGGMLNHGVWKGYGKG